MSKGIIFDLDGLLFDTEKVYYEETQKVADELGLYYTKATYLDLLGKSDEEVWKEYYELYKGYEVKTVAKLIDESYSRVGAIFDAGDVDLKPGVKELLTFLQAKGIMCAVASSNTRPRVEQLLEQADIDQYFSYLVTSEDVLNAKPDPAIFEATVKKMGLKKADVLILEDSENGALAALAAGISVVLVPDLLEPSPEISKKVQAVVPDLIAVKERLAKDFN
jgi:HAD superfamily hydrolase (TIGR01509 family)